MIVSNSKPWIIKYLELMVNVDSDRALRIIADIVTRKWYEDNIIIYLNERYKYNNKYINSRWFLTNNKHKIHFKQSVTH